MRMRKKKNCDVRMERCEALWVRDPFSARGRWNEVFGNDHPIHLEIGCGKGRFITECARRDPQINFVAVERVRDVLVMAMEKAAAAELTNVRFLDLDAQRLEEVFSPAETERIYLNFSDPWKKNRQAKRRLTHRLFLERYAALLPADGEVFFKTDNRALFEFSLNSFAEADLFRLRNITLDLHNSGFEGNIMTEYEQRFSEQGMPIYRLEAYRR